MIHIILLEYLKLSETEVRADLFICIFWQSNSN